MSTDVFTPSSPATLSRSRFRSVKDMLASSSPTKPSTARKLKRPNKNANSILSSKSPNVPSSKASLSAQNGKITGKSTKLSSSTAVPLSKSNSANDPFDIFNIPSSSPETPPPSPPAETNKARDPYIPAKRVWTPIKENSKPEVIDLCTPDDVSKPTTASFTSILTSYKHDELPTTRPLVRENNEPLRKRRCIEILEIPNAPVPAARKTSATSTVSKENKPKKAKSAAPRKSKTKAMTITGIAVAPYITAPSDATPPADTLADKPEAERSSKPAKPTNRKKRQPSGIQTTLVPVPEEKPKKMPPAPLLSPTSAKKRMDTQAFVFGTSSQLIQSHPPTAGWALETTGRKLNTIQTNAKIHAKATFDINGYDCLDETADGDEPVENVRSEYKLTTECTDDTTGWGISELGINNGFGRKDGTNRGKMWDKAARGIHGDFHHLEVVDLMDEDELDVDEIFSQRISTQIEVTRVEASIPTPASSTTTTVAKVTAKRKQKKDVDQLIRPAKQPGDALPAAYCTQLPTPDSTSPDPEPKSSKPKPTVTKPSSQIEDEAAVKSKQASRTTATTNLPSRPNFEGFTLLQLQTQIKQYGFKPVKSRTGMINMLNQCWDSVEATAAAGGPEQPTVLPVTATAATSKQPAGRGRKKKQVDDDEQQGESAPPPKKRGRKPKAAAATATTTEVGDKARSTATVVSQRDCPLESTFNGPLDTGALFKHIAAAIKQQPASGDMLAPSWWQRILMNETIVLEDFADWLSDCGVREAVWETCGIVGQTGKLAAVKMWCEARSVSFCHQE
ncbi:hypothetical protein ABW21_db0205347 [Orbilia brochopaga]|nr:hypothetical protein ABW21_db0205347 [Drechslerella brochopaga]